jgi:thiamine biosynthesis lipoprotein
MSPDRFRAMGAEVVVGGGVGGAEARRLFARWERTFSRFVADSELNHVNASEQPFVGVTPLFAAALSEALAAAAATSGLVDPTLGAALEAAGYDRDFAELADDPRPAGRPVTGSWRSLRLAGTLLFRLPGTTLDLNCVVKGMAVDAALALGDGDGFVSAGGDVAVRGEVAVGLPDGGSLMLRDGGIATSGSTGRRWRRGGQLQHHLLDPRSGRPSASRWHTVTVVGQSCLRADVAAKAAFLLSDDGPDWLDERGLPGSFFGDCGAVANRAWRDAIAGASVAA